MTVTTATIDLAEKAERRARLAAVLGRVLVAEPGPDLFPLVAGMEAFASLASGDPALASDYERLLLREVALFESVFLGDDGQRGGPRTAAVAASYEAAGFDGATRWRVAGPDHLGLELLAYAHICTREAEAWRHDQPDAALAAVEAARSLLAEHLGQWAEVAMEALRHRGGDSPYVAVAGGVSAFLAEEADRLRPAPDHPDLPDAIVEPPPRRSGPARLARWLLAPARSGAFLDHDDLAAAAHALGIPWRPSDPRSRFRQVVEDAVDGGDLAALLDALRPPVERWHAFHAAREAGRDGDRRVWRVWRLRAEATLELLDTATLGRRSDTTADGPVVVTVTAPDDRLVASTVARLRTLGAAVSVAVDVEPRLGAILRSAFAAGADDVALGLAGGSAVAVRGGAELGGIDVVVRVEVGAPELASVTVDPSDDRPLAVAARRAVADAGEGCP